MAKTRVLIIEDEPVIVLDLELTLEEMDYEICGVADTAADAVAKAADLVPDLILADIRLRNGDDGIAAVKEILRRRHVPVLFITGNWRELRRRGMPEALAIGKPFLPDILKRAIEDALLGRA
jgi:CheY-like chemotaxis protein